MARRAPRGAFDDESTPQRPTRRPWPRPGLLFEVLEIRDAHAHVLRRAYSSRFSVLDDLFFHGWTHANHEPANLVRALETAHFFCFMENNHRWTDRWLFRIVTQPRAQLLNAS